MAYNTYETIDNTLRGEPYGQLTPEGQKLWDEYQSLLAGQKNAPMANLRLRSGATMPIIEPGFGLKNRMLSKTLGGMSGTGMGTRAGAQPGLFAQLAPLFIAAGIKDPKEIKKLMDLLGGTKSTPTPELSSPGGYSGGGDSLPSGGFGAEDWGSLAGDVPVEDYSDLFNSGDWSGMY